MVAENLANFKIKRAN